MHKNCWQNLSFEIQNSRAQVVNCSRKASPRIPQSQVCSKLDKGIVGFMIKSPGLRGYLMFSIRSCHHRIHYRIPHGNDVIVSAMASQITGVLDCLLKRLFMHRSKKAPKLRSTGLWEGHPPVSGGFPSQRASNAENVSIWWRCNDSLVNVINFEALYKKLLGNLADNTLDWNMNENTFIRRRNTIFKENVFDSVACKMAARFPGFKMLTKPFNNKIYMSKCVYLWMAEWTGEQPPLFGVRLRAIISVHFVKSTFRRAPEKYFSIRC